MRKGVKQGRARWGEGLCETPPTTHTHPYTLTPYTHTKKSMVVLIQRQITDQGVQLNTLFSGQNKVKQEITLTHNSKRNQVGYLFL